MEDVREDADDGDVSRIQGKDEYDTDEVPDDAVDFLPLRLAHQEPKVHLPYLCKGRGGEAQTEDVGRDDRGEAGAEHGEEGADGGRVEVVQEQGEEACIVSSAEARSARTHLWKSGTSSVGSPSPPPTWA